MNHISLESAGLALLGLIIHELFKLMKRKNTDSKFSFSRWAKENWLYTFVSLLCTFALLFMMDDLCSLFGISMEDGSSLESIAAFTFGYLNQSLIKNLLGIVKGKVSSKSKKSDVDTTQKSEE